MQCTLAEKLIPLFVGDDLPDDQMNAMRGHLDTCAGCRQLAVEFGESHAWLRTLAAPAFSDATLEGLRDAVRREIASAQRQPAWLERWMPRWSPPFKRGFALAVAAILLVAAVGVFKWRNQPDRPSPLVLNNRDAVTPPVKPKVQYRELQRPLTRQRARARKPGSLTLPAPQPAPVAPEPALVANNATANQEMLRIEMQTADPNIRIIWFAPKTDAPTQSNNK